MLHNMLAIHNASLAGHIPFPDYIQAETKFYQEASGEDIAAYNQYLYDGT